MKEHPILMSAPMVRALLENRKTQTRRVVKPIMELGSSLSWCKIATSSERLLRHQVSGYQQHCPYGVVGDLLWVRETHLPTARGVMYRADFSELEAAGVGTLYGGWKPSIFCKREHSRITLEIVGTRVERLQDINHADAMAEGITGEELFRAQGYAPKAYKKLWESINGAGSWDTNPWVWCIEFNQRRES